MNKPIISLTILSVLSIGAAAQSGGIFTITQSVVAGGGRQDFAGGSFAAAGTNGQDLAGTVSEANGFSVRGGFWSANLIPTAAAVSISGRVSAGSNGLSRAIVTLTGADGAMRTATTNSFGLYRFDDVEAGATYIVSVTHKRGIFAPQVINVNEDLHELNFMAEAQ